MKISFLNIAIATAGLVRGRGGEPRQPRGSPKGGAGSDEPSTARAPSTKSWKGVHAESERRGEAKTTKANKTKKSSKATKAFKTAKAAASEGKSKSSKTSKDKTKSGKAHAAKAAGTSPAAVYEAVEELVVEGPFEDQFLVQTLEAPVEEDLADADLVNGEPSDDDPPEDEPAEEETAKETPIEEDDDASGVAAVVVIPVDELQGKAPTSSPNSSPTVRSTTPTSSSTSSPTVRPTTPTSSPTSSPTTAPKSSITSSPTVRPRWDVDYLGVTADSSIDRALKLAFDYEISVDRIYEALLLATDCQSPIAGVEIELTAERVPKDMYTDSLSLIYDIDKSFLTESDAWNVETGRLRVCHVVRLLLPNPFSPEEPVWVIIEDKRRFGFDGVEVDQGPENTDPAEEEPAEEKYAKEDPTKELISGGDH